MSYGALIYNDTGTAIINDVDPVYVSVHSGTLTSGAIDADGFYEYDMLKFNSVNFRVFGDTDPATNTYYPPDYDLNSNNAILFFNLPVGESGIFMRYGPDKNFNRFGGVYTTNSSNQYFHIVCPRNLLSAPTGYGIAFFNAAGQTMWDHSVAVGYIGSGTTSLAINQQFSHQAGDLWIGMPVTRLAWPNPATYDPVNIVTESEFMQIRRIDSSTVIFESYKTTSNSNSGGENATAIEVPLFVGKF